jgi:hypothetical protein
MKPIRIKLCIVISMLITISLALTSLATYGQKSTAAQNQDNPKKTAAIKKISSIYRKSTFSSAAIDTILVTAQKATMNFDTYVYLASIAAEFGYGTGDLLKLAAYASKTKYETDCFKQLADLAMMKAGPGIYELAESVSKQDKPDNAKIERSIQALKNTAHFKTMEEARSANKAEMEKLNKQ